MAKPAWVTLSKIDGVGSDNIVMGGNPYTGRLVRSGTVSIQNQSGTKPSKIIAISQQAKAEFTSKVSALPLSIPAAGGKITITLNSNSSSISLYFENELFALTAENVSAKINNVPQTISKEDDPFGIDILVIGDTGASAEYTMVIEITVPASTSAKIRSLHYSLNDGGKSGGFDVTDITQMGAASTLSVNPESLTLVAAGTAQNVAVTSNDSWVVS